MSAPFHADLASLVAARDPRLRAGPVAVILAEDPVEVDSTLRHHLDVGFAAVILLALPDIPVAADLEKRVVRVTHDPFRDISLPAAATRIGRSLPPGTWLYWGYNAEYLIHPFAETRGVPEMLAFHVEERRPAMVAVVVDLYAGDLAAHPDGVDRAGPLFDARGYHGRPAEGATADTELAEGVTDIFGGLRWRFEEHVPWDRRRIDRVALLRCHPGLTIGEHARTGEAEADSLQCPWHRNLTACVASFRTAKALLGNPEPRRVIRSFVWPGSARFDWTSRQLMEAGLMEPGQWF